MITQRSRAHHTTNCPICGRPVEVQSQYINHEIACGHCRGHFVVYESDDDRLAAAALRGNDSLDRAEQLLQDCGACRRLRASEERHQLLDLQALSDDDERRHDTRLEAHDNEAEQQPTAILVEYRDEVFARIAADMTHLGMRVVRANSATEALKLCGAYRPSLVVANVDLPDQNGWLLAGKLQFVDQQIRIWLYQSNATSHAEGMGDIVRVHQLIDYDGDLLGLSDTIIRLLASRCEPNDATYDKAEELAAV